MSDPTPLGAGDGIVDATIAAALIAKSLADERGYFSCPLCETGTVHYGRASNGHTRGKCDKEGGCISWVE